MDKEITEKAFEPGTLATMFVGYDTIHVVNKKTGEKIISATCAKTIAEHCNRLNIRVENKGILRSDLEKLFTA